MKHLFQKFRLGVDIFRYLHVRLFSGCWSAKKTNPVGHIWYWKPWGWLGSGNFDVWNNFPGDFFLRRIRSESNGSPDPSRWVNPNSPLQRFRLNYRSSCSQKAPPSTPGPPDTPSLPCKCDTFQTFSHNTSTLEGTNIEAVEEEKEEEEGSFERMHQQFGRDVPKKMK